jgi:hypothetical protein
MSPEEYAALKAAASVKLYRDAEGNFVFDARQARTAVLPRDILEQLETARAAEITGHEKRLKDLDTFYADLKNAS